MAGRASAVRDRSEGQSEGSVRLIAGLPLDAASEARFVRFGHGPAGEDRVERGAEARSVHGLGVAGSARVELAPVGEFLIPVEEEEVGRAPRVEGSGDFLGLVEEVGETPAGLGGLLGHFGRRVGGVRLGVVGVDRDDRDSAFVVVAKLGDDYEGRVSIIAINANNTETHPADAPPKMTEKAAEARWSFPYLFDETQEVARAFDARCTPDFFLFDGDQKLAYRGQLDASRPSNAEPVDGSSLRPALDAVLAGRPVPEPHEPSLGCGIKWKPGNEPN